MEMAGQFGLNILLLWAGIVTLASSFAPSPALTNHTSTVTETNVPNSVTAQTSTQTSPDNSPDQSSTNSNAFAPSPALTNHTSTVTETNVPNSVTAQTSTQTSPDNSPDQSSTNSNASAASPAHTNHTSTVTETNVPNSVTAQTSTQTSPDHSPDQSSTNSNAANQNTASPMTTASTTMTPTTRTQISTPSTPSDDTHNASTQPPQVSSCSYTLHPIQFGFRIKIDNFSSDQNFTLTLEDQTDGTTEKYSVKNKTDDIEGLKPCTDYRHNLSFTLNMNLSYCKQSVSGNVINPPATTQPLKSADFMNAERKKDKMLCYQSKWNIYNSVFEVHTKNKTHFCIKYNDSHICTNFMKNVPTNCNSPITLSKFIDLDSSDIKMTPVGRYPKEFTPPPNCKNWNVSHTCSEKDNSHGNKSLSELEPYTNYSCTATVTRENVTRTRHVNVRIDCKLQLNEISNTITNTSMDMRWKLSSSVCEGQLPRFHFSYECQCNDTHKGGRHDVNFLEAPCNFSGLHVYTNYKCGINVKYNNETISSSNHTFQTGPGRPEKPHIKSLVVKNRNGITVTWKKIRTFYGPKEMYIVRLFEGDTQKEEKNIIQENEKTIAEVVFTGLSYSTTYTVKVTAFNGHIESDSFVESINTNYDEMPLIGFLVFLIILTSVALILVAYKIYILRRERSRDSSESMILIPKTNDEDRLIFVEPITAETLLDAYKRKIADEGRLFLAEFQSIPRIFSKYTVKEAKKSHNVPKNRYVDILPYDYNRVQLTTGNGSTGCDYINASFIDGFKESKKYIAAQGPKEETVSDFWRMIWEQQTSIIVMVSRCEEGNRVKCAQYWPSPERDTEIFEEFIVKLTLEDHYPDYIIRHLSLTNKRDKGSEREVTHIQFMSWPDHGVPEEAHLLLKLRRRVNSFKNFFSGPIVIHCSAGVGRTGTYIGIDAMMESLEAEGRADIYGYVVTLRRQRCLMVQVEAQYILIHQALLEHTQFGETESPLQELHSTLNTLKQRSSDNESTLMEEEFDRLPTFKNWKTFNTGIAEENKKKNRTSSVIPYDYNRVLLKVDEGQSHESDPDDDYEMSSDDDNEDAAKYINASLISGYWGPHAFVVAQTPLPDTVADFWSMILQYRVSAVVMLSDCSQTDEECLLWGEDKKTFEDTEVELESTENSPNFTLRNMLIHHEKTKARQQVKHFQFLKWANRELPEKPQDLVDLIKEIKHRCGLTWPRNTPVVIHCNDGSSRSGVFCGLWNLLDSAKKEKTVDVFQVVKTLRKERQRMFSSLEQYQFLYDALEGIVPVQNGDVKAAQNSVQIVNETRAAERPCSTTSADQQEAEESADGGVSAATEEEDSKCPTVTVEV